MPTTKQLRNTYSVCVTWSAVMRRTSSRCAREGRTTRNNDETERSTNCTRTLVFRSLERRNESWREESGFASWL